MERNQATAHADRVNRLLESLRGATQQITTTLERASEDAAQHCPKQGQWSATQIGYHVALTNEWFAGAFSRTGVTLPFLGESDFDDESWNLDAPPVGVQAPGLLEPPARVTRREAVDKIQSSAERLAPFLAQLTSEDGSAMCVTVPWATISLYQLAEWAGGHALRHLRQMRRALAAFAVSQQKSSRSKAS
jgi:hypothetical protein